MVDQLKYSASLTGDSFLFYEARQVVRLKLNGLNEQQIREEVKDKNIFQYGTEKRLTKRITAVFSRIKFLDETLLRFLAEETSETARIINLYAIMKTNRLMFDFIVEIIGEKFETGNLNLEKRDVNEFFVAKREQSENVAKWSDETVAKLKQVLKKNVFDVGILSDPKTGKLQRLSLDPEVIRHFEEMGEVHLLNAMGINI